MSDLPDVTVVICTYNRPIEIRRTISALMKNLIYPPNLIHWHIADDGTDQQPHYVEEVLAYISNRRPPQPAPGPGYTITPHLGWGANVNAALRAVETDYVYFTEDDYVLMRPLQLAPYVLSMEVQKQIGLVRFGIAGHSLACHLREVDISAQAPAFQENDSNSGYESQGKVNMFILDPELSVGPFSLYQYSNRPHLKHRRFHEAYGLYPEGLSLGAAEEAFNHQMRSQWVRNSTPSIACPADWVLWHYAHIGESRQGTGEDPNAS